MPNPLEAAATPDVAPVKDAVKEVSPFQSEINSLDTLNDLEKPNSDSSADKFLPKLSLDDATNGEATQMDSKVKESTKESKRAKQEHLNQKWKVRPDPTNCGEQDNDS